VSAAVDRHAAALARDGWCVFGRAIEPTVIAGIEADLEPRFAATPLCQGAFYGAQTKRFGSLLTRAPAIERLAMHPLILELVEQMLLPWCERIALNLTQAIEIHPGALPQLPHRDQDMWQGPKGSIEYLVMFPQAVPRLVFGLALLWAWLNMPVPIYGTLWLLALAYFTVMLPIGVRTLAGVVLQVDKSLEECARVCGAGWVYQLRTITLPLLKPGVIAAWLLIFMACVRELGVSVFLMGPNAKVIAPSIVSAFASSGIELTAAMALIQTFTVVVALLILFRLTRGITRELT